MSPEEELQQYKKKVLRDNRIAIVIMGIAFLISVFSLIYGITKSIEVNTEREQAQFEVKRLTQELQKCQSQKK